MDFRKWYLFLLKLCHIASFLLQIGSLSTYILDLALPYVHMLDQSPSVQAAAAIYLAHETLENEFEITSKVCLRSLMHHLDCEEEEITNCVSEFVKLLQRAAKENIQVWVCACVHACVYVCACVRACVRVICYKRFHLK